MFNLKTPCKQCPFLKNSPTPLHPERLPSIVDGLDAGNTFYCHKTIDYNNQFEEDEDEGRVFSAKSSNQFCAGALIFLEKQGRPNQAMRIAERLGLYNHKELQGKDRVIDHLDERTLF